MPLIPIAVETFEQTWRNFALTHRYVRKRAKTQSIRQLIVGRIVARYHSKSHGEADGVLFILEGTGFAVLGDKRMPIEKGSAKDLLTSHT